MSIDTYKMSFVLGVLVFCFSHCCKEGKQTKRPRHREKLNWHYCALNNNSCQHMRLSRKSILEILKKKKNHVHQLVLPFPKAIVPILGFYLKKKKNLFVFNHLGKL